MSDLTNDYPVAFHNVGELERLGELPGVLLSRFPRRVREELNRRARHVALKGIARSEHVSPSDVAFNAILRELAAAIDSPDLSLIDGEQVMDQLSALRTDVLHPSAYGHAVMGLNVADLLRPAIAAKGLVDGV